MPYASPRGRRKTENAGRDAESGPAPPPAAGNRDCAPEAAIPTRRRATGPAKAGRSSRRRSQPAVADGHPRSGNSKRSSANATISLPGRSDQPRPTACTLIGSDASARTIVPVIARRDQGIFDQPQQPRPQGRLTQVDTCGLFGTRQQPRRLENLLAIPRFGGRLSQVLPKPLVRRLFDAARVGIVRRPIGHEQHVVLRLGRDLLIRSGFTRPVPLRNLRIASSCGAQSGRNVWRSGQPQRAVRR